MRLYWVLLVLFVLLLEKKTAANECYSCFASCSGNESHSCDCEGKMCPSEFCFAKVEIFGEENTRTVLKGENFFLGKFGPKNEVCLYDQGRLPT